MICSRCAHWNNEDEHRCTKCAARLNDRQVESAFHVRGALAMQPEVRSTPVAVMESAPEVVPGEHGVSPASESTRVPRHAWATQQTLFASRESGKIVSIDGNEPAPRPARKPAPAARRRPATASYLPQQGVLEFVPVAAPQARKLATSVDARIYCEHEVASVTHRTFAALYDLGFIGVLVVTFLGMLSWGCEDLLTAMMDPVSAVVVGAGAVLIGLLYHTVFLTVRGRTPGMEFAGLRLVDFDGRRPSREQLAMRIFGNFVSVLPAGVGLLWALVDEENLTWQDHISHTFPTPVTTE